LQNEGLSEVVFSTQHKIENSSINQGKTYQSRFICKNPNINTVKNTTWYNMVTYQLSKAKKIALFSN